MREREGGGDGRREERDFIIANNASGRGFG